MPRKPPNAGDPRSGAFKRTHDNFGARTQYANTTVSSSATKSWWTSDEAKADRNLTHRAVAEVERMKLSTFGRTVSAVLTDG
jgi:hypothetical protein